eukprot:evm.model.scf_305.9 EVM.evm.TU.scf_305.9   scf_305:58346-68084(-)
MALPRRRALCALLNAASSLGRIGRSDAPAMASPLGTAAFAAQRDSLPQAARKLTLFGGGPGVASGIAPMRFISVDALRPSDRFAPRHNSVSEADAAEMLKVCGYKTVDDLISATVPSAIRRGVMNIGRYDAGLTESEYLEKIRLEGLLAFQTVVCDLTGMEIANASLLDEATAAAEGMGMCSAMSRGKKPRFLISDKCHPQTITVCQTRASGLGIKVEVGDAATWKFGPDVSGALVQYPATDGTVSSYKNLRMMPGRLIGVSKDSHGRPALRMALQTREQHIRRDKATSNICTAQALLANIAAMYAVYHGPEGLKTIANRVHGLAATLAEGAKQCGHKVQKQPFFDTVCVDVKDAKKVAALAADHQINVRVLSPSEITIALDETTTLEDVDALLCVLNGGVSPPFTSASLAPKVQPTLGPHARTTPYLEQHVFNAHHSEHEMLRYLKKLENRDLSLVHSMIPLGSCTMKLNATSEMMPITWNELANLHPFVPANQAEGYKEMFEDLAQQLCAITAFDSVSLQPNAGASGEYAGLMAIRQYHRSRGDHARDVCLIPASAHGTNPASAAMAGMKIVTIRSDDQGNVDIAQLREKAIAHKDKLAALMITYPSTHGVYEEGVDEICKIIHDNGGQVYMDGANMNAQVGLTAPGVIGADVCHLNLHKTFCIPHGGGGPGMGPIGVKAHLAPFLPSHPVVNTGGLPVPDGKLDPFGTVSAAPFGSSLILPISYAYISMMGSKGLTEASKLAILNANYMACRLSSHYPILFKGKNGTCAHEFMIDVRPLKASAGIEESDIAKRLIDYGFHSPTMSWPVAGTLMIEPTESESKAELDRFCTAMIAIRGEIQEIIDGKADKENNLMKNAPHPAHVVLSDSWNYPYPRERAAYPADWVRNAKFWPSTSRVDNVHGDRHIIARIPTLEEARAEAYAAAA